MFWTKPGELREPLNAHGWFDGNARSARTQAERCGFPESPSWRRPGARFLVLADLKPVVRSNAQRTEAKLAWFSREDLTEFGLPLAEALFLGVDKASGNGHFALAVTEHRTRHVPGAIEKLRPIVDLRSLAMQGIMSPEELSLCGQARALAQWHENARCCGHCGGTTLVKDGGWKRKCWACGLEWFPRTDPVVIMLITDGSRCLLAHEHRYGDKMFSDARRLHRARRGHRARRAPRGDSRRPASRSARSRSTRASRGRSRTPSCWAASARPRPPSS